MEKCILTGRLLTDEQTVETREGPVASWLWGTCKVKHDSYGFVLWPVKLLEKYRLKMKKDPEPSSMEDGGACLIGKRNL